MKAIQSVLSALVLTAALACIPCATAQGTTPQSYLSIYGAGVKFDCSFGTVTFIAGGGSGTGRYVWGGAAASAGTTVTDSVAIRFWPSMSIGTYTVTVYKEGDANYAASNVASETVTATYAFDPGQANIYAQSTSISVGQSTAIQWQQYGGSTPWVVGPGVNQWSNQGYINFTGASPGRYQWNMYTGGSVSYAVVYVNGPQGTVGISPSSTTVTAGANVQFTASGGAGTGAYLWTLPGGSTVTQASGSYTVAFPSTGTYQVSVQKQADATYTASNTATATITVNPALPPPVISSATSATGTQGTAFSYQITATNSPTSFGASGLPAGLSLNASNGLISGTPSVFGSYSVTLTAANASGSSNPVTLTLTLSPQPPPAPVITSTGSATGTEGAAFTYQITASNSPTSFAATGLPNVLTLNTSTGVISGTPTQSGAFTVTLTATNAGGTSNPATLALSIATGSVTFTKIGGDYQSAAPGAFNANKFDVAVYNTSTQPVAGAPVTFTVQTGGGLLSTSNTGTPAPTSTVIVATDADGTAQVYYKQPSVANVTSQITASTNAANNLTFTTQNFTVTGDTDNDGLPDAWENQYFGNTTSATGSGDNDGDGLTNEQEYQLGTDPTKAMDGTLPGAAGTYQLVLATPSGAYIGVKPDWSLTPVAAP